MTGQSIDAARLLGRIRTLDEIGRDADGRLIRLAASDTEKLGRDRFAGWIEGAGLEVAVDRIGNIFGIWKPEGTVDAAPLMLGSHIDTVIGAGIYDGCYGTLSGLEVIETLKAEGLTPSRPIVVAAFTNEEGVRYAPDMMGSLVCAGGLDVDTALATIGTDGTMLGDELERIGYAGEHQPGFLRPHAYIELHIEQGPILEREGILVGAVEHLQSISWQRVVITGDANHAGTTPIPMRRDAGHAAARVVTFLRDRAQASNTPMVATVGCMRFEPDVINVIPSRAPFTVDLRDPDEDRLKEEEAALATFLDGVSAEEQVGVSMERLARFEPVKFDQRIVRLVEKAARDRGIACRRMTSGAGHDAQMIARIAPSAMIFVPSIGGISHNPKEYTADEDLVAGTNILLDVVRRLATEGLPA
ncbi:Zn-dependent hydrolase [Rhizobium leguminosarum]|uniref:Zn-dependent hydrolase n=1 Tax=Rhizobium leguminosarum TaxID=384 RepID=UPI00103BD1BE|nr:Zn-dependent hydrolase [Rhizobium leguminosarum]MBY5496854.1 Zn-dependent hydrolase [Rhizobium leguminosarum]TBZ42046.1 Zn-dependent hydrolase [Rhizobium leguminosarum bv. viciae]TCA11977.1 Zn-dependent hydrolase [Rhizobium leguminosarum bv. viciae]TCA19060.1 Zn-dependent hydrolase [Rhizobium leguminosarum bv. viciae]